MKLFVHSSSSGLEGLSRYLATGLHAQGVELVNGQQSEEMGVSLVDLHTYLSETTKLKTCLIAIDWDHDEPADLAKLQKYIEKNSSNIAGLIDLARPYYSCMPAVRAAVDQHQQQVDKLLVQSLESLKRVRQIHEKVVPLRQERVKGATIFGKYGAGLGSGGEFYDMVKNDQGIFLFMSSSNSYVASSMVLSHFDLFKRKKCRADASLEFIKGLEQELQRLGEKEHRGVHLLAMQLDLEKMKLTGHYFGNFWCQDKHNILFTNNQLPVSFALSEKAFFSKALTRSDRMVIASPGLMGNLPVNAVDKYLRDFVKDNINKGSKFILDELFFTLKREDVDHFLNFDATAVVMEVDDNVLVKM